MKTVYKLLSHASWLSGVIGGLYVGGYLMFIKPIFECLTAYDAGLLTGAMIGITLLKCLFAGTVGCLIAYAGYFLALVFVYAKRN